jgi:hypothetical protein
MHCKTVARRRLTNLLLAFAIAAAAAEPTPGGRPTTVPRYASKPPVEDYYPAGSRSAKEQGTTKLNLCYDDQGRPIQVTVKESSFHYRGAPTIELDRPPEAVLGP